MIYSGDCPHLAVNDYYYHMKGTPGGQQALSLYSLVLAFTTNKSGNDMLFFTSVQMLVNARFVGHHYLLEGGKYLEK